MPVEKENRKFTSFVTPRGQFEFLKTPFGLCNSPAVFVLYTEVFQDLMKDRVVLIYRDALDLPAKN